MLFGNKSREIVFLRHLLMAVISVVLVYFVWRLNSAWSADMRLWKAFGGATFALLWFTVFIGPAARLWKPLGRLLTWRRESGIWFVLIGLIHGYLVLDGWARWQFWEFLGYQYVAELGMYLRAEPGFGLANIMGLFALILGVVLATTSFDKVVNFLGASSWKWLHMFSYVIFYISALHVLYFVFIHFTPSPQRVLMGLSTNYPANPLRFYYLFAMLSTFVVQMGAFVKTVYQRRKAGIQI